MELNYVIFAVIILILACIWWFLYHKTEADLAVARAAVKEVIAKQQIDINGYNMRADLHLTKLEQVRLAHSESTNAYNQLNSQLNASGNGAAGLDRETEIVCGNAYAKVLQTQRQLEASITMVKAFLESNVFYRKKWNEQAVQLVIDYRITRSNPTETYLLQLLLLPNGINNAQGMLKTALGID